MSNKRKKFVDDDDAERPPAKRARKQVAQDHNDDDVKKSDSEMEAAAVQQDPSSAVAAAAAAAPAAAAAAQGLQQVVEEEQAVDVDVKCRGTPVTVFAKHLPFIDLVSSFASAGGQGCLHIDFKTDDLHAVLDALCEGKDFLLVHQWPVQLQRIVKFLGANLSKYAVALKELKKECFQRVETTLRDPSHAFVRPAAFDVRTIYLTGRHKLPEACAALLERFSPLTGKDGAPLFETATGRILEIKQSDMSWGSFPSFTYQVMEVVPVAPTSPEAHPVAREDWRQQRFRFLSNGD